VPKARDSIRFEDFAFQVEEMDGRSIKKVRMTVNKTDDDAKASL